MYYAPASEIAKGGDWFESKPVNQFSDSDWEGTGVEPDVKAEEADALEVAEKPALPNWRNNNPAAIAEIPCC